MPILVIPASEAMENRKRPDTSWGQRGGENRVEPVATPTFGVPFQFVPGEPIFTVGSCFARNVEYILEARGFVIPALDLFATAEFKGLNRGILNNYGVPSIANEFNWALDPEDHFDDERNFVEVSRDRYVDLHLPPSQAAAPIEEVRRRRRALIKATARVRECRVVIITLGLSELWFDREQGIYLNTTPGPRSMKAFPERFELHVLSYEDCKFHIDRALDALARWARPDQQILLTVSPVPLERTFRPMDVIVANTYSKSCLRTVAEAAIAERSNVHYFPSYESVMLSERRLAWVDDLVHPTQEIVKLNVSRLVRAFAPIDDFVASAADEIASGGSLVALEIARTLSGEKSSRGIDFFETQAKVAQQEPAFAMEAARFYLNYADTREAARFLGLVPADFDPIGRAILAARIANFEHNSDRAIEELMPHRFNQKASSTYWRTLFAAFAAGGRSDDARRLAEMAGRQPGRVAAKVFSSLGWSFRSADPATAAWGFEKALPHFVEPDRRCDLAYVEALLASGQTEAAQAHAAMVRAAEPTDAEPLETAIHNATAKVAASA